MSVSLMSSIFKTEFRDLQDAEGNTTKASTAKFVCIALADHANDDGEGAYPSLAKIAYKTSLSRTAVINAIDALKHNGILIANGPSKYDTVNYTVNPACFVSNGQPGVLVNWVDSPSQPGLLPPVNPVDPNHTLTIPEPSTDASFPEPTPTKKQGDLVDGWLALSQSPGIKRQARIDAILSVLAERLHVRTTGKRWEEFAKLVDDRQQNFGEKLDVFLEWLVSQKGFNPQYWPPSRMAEFWPQAFINNGKPKTTGRSLPEIG